MGQTNLFQEKKFKPVPGGMSSVGLLEAKNEEKVNKNLFIL